ncbi:hypothetical protein SAMN05444161_3035 [Rhizobiales bacterium GAS191]|nr:hypothetical protein SAMN05519103_02232 [Rhizobiales bacterium GAS113]SED35793.1 hypothetical protein SAMN05444161_3035 [Rhizobiales bacterium GAS191]
MAGPTPGHDAEMVSPGARSTWRALLAIERNVFFQDAPIGL